MSTLRTLGACAAGAMIALLLCAALLWALGALLGV